MKETQSIVVVRCSVHIRQRTHLRESLMVLNKKRFSLPKPMWNPQFLLLNYLLVKESSQWDAWQAEIQGPQLAETVWIFNSIKGIQFHIRFKWCNNTLLRERFSLQMMTNLIKRRALWLCENPVTASHHCQKLDRLLVQIFPFLALAEQIGPFISFRNVHCSIFEADWVIRSLIRVLKTLLLR